MIVLELDQVETDYCTFCQGIWLDEGELELLLDGSKAAAAMLGSLKPAENVRETPRSCPRCRKKMNKVYIGTSSEILLDSCKKGHGLWFDEGELQHVATMAANGEETRMLKLLSDMFEYNLKKNKQ
jgi:Zn-finger nucleic acid-binding protein